MTALGRQLVLARVVRGSSNGNGNYNRNGKGNYNGLSTDFTDQEDRQLQTTFWGTAKPTEWDTCVRCRRTHDRARHARVARDYQLLLPARVASRIDPLVAIRSSIVCAKAAASNGTDHRRREARSMQDGRRLATRHRL